MVLQKRLLPQLQNVVGLSILKNQTAKIFVMITGKWSDLETTLTATKVKIHFIPIISFACSGAFLKRLPATAWSSRGISATHIVKCKNKARWHWFGAVSHSEYHCSINATVNSSTTSTWCRLYALWHCEEHMVFKKRTLKMFCIYRFYTYEFKKKKREREIGWKENFDQVEFWKNRW